MEIKNEMRYTRKTEIGVGKGWNSQVWLVEEPQLGGELVVKEMPKSRFGGAVAEYFKEAQAMFASASPNVAPLHWAGETPAGHSPELVCICMPYFRRGSLADRIVKSPLPISEVLRVGHGILLGLGSIHARRFIHFDLKPSNVLFNNQDEPLVADFGQTCACNPIGTATPSGLYPDAVPPELYKHFVGTIQSDIYHAGLTLYRAVNADPFYAAQVPGDAGKCMRLTCSGKFPDRSLFMPHVPKSLRTVIRKALRVNPAERYSSAAEMADALVRVSVANDWHVNVTSSGTTWTAKRDSRPDLIVSQRPAGATWNVQIHTQRNGDMPRGRDCARWKDSQPRGESDEYLKNLFDSLESA